MWTEIFIVLILVTGGFLLFMYRRDKKYLSKPMREVLGDDLKKEIEKEKTDFTRHQTLFEKALKKAEDRSQKSEVRSHK